MFFVVSGCWNPWPWGGTVPLIPVLSLRTSILVDPVWIGMIGFSVARPWYSDAFTVSFAVISDHFGWQR